MKITALWAAALGLAACYPAFTARADIFEARALYIGDGDSLTARASGRPGLRLRLYGVDAPELGQPYGHEAKNFLIRLAAKKKIQVEAVETDAYGRLVALVSVDGVSVNLALAEAGLAWFYGRYCGRADICPALKAAEGRARAARRGLWREERPCPPERWRRKGPGYFDYLHGM